MGCPLPLVQKYAYVYLMDVETYLHKMLVSDELKKALRNTDKQLRSSIM